jgi:hypothetical protein
MIFLCTLFDRRYLNRGIALHASLVRHGSDFKLWILSLDAETVTELDRLRLPNVECLTVDELMREEGRLEEAKANRSPVEFYFTLKSFLLQYIINNCEEVDLISFIDADTFFFSRASVLHEEMEGYSIGLTPHRFREGMTHLEKYGKFNAGFISIRRDSNGLKALAWWMDQCYQCCHDYPDDGKYADQLYLNSLPHMFDKVKIFNNKGINLAPWNISQHTIDFREEEIMVDGNVLVFFHFHGLKKINPMIYNSGCFKYRAPLSDRIRNMIYLPYIRTLLEAEKKIMDSCADKSIRIYKGGYAGKVYPGIIIKLLRAMFHLVKSLYYRSYIYFDPASAKNAKPIFPHQ